MNALLPVVLNHNKSSISLLLSANQISRDMTHQVVRDSSVTYLVRDGSLLAIWNRGEASCLVWADSRAGVATINNGRGERVATGRLWTICDMSRASADSLTRILNSYIKVRGDKDESMRLAWLHATIQLRHNPNLGQVMIYGAPAVWRQNA